MARHLDSLDPEEEAAYWEHGYLKYLLHKDLQRRVYDFTHAWKEAHPNSALPVIWDLHRAAGKTYELALIGIERAIRWPGQEIRFGASTVTQADEIVEPNIRKILARMPAGFTAFRRSDKGGPYYEIRNPFWGAGEPSSYFRIIGCREKADTHRGKRSHCILLDECRDIDAFEYIAKVVFAPHFATMDYPLFVMSSTPPESMDHAWYRIYCTQAMDDGRYYCGPVKGFGSWPDDLDWSQEDDERMLELFHDRDTPEWQREMQCQHISDPTRLVVPEFNEELDTAETYDRPQYFYPLVVADGGFIDYFACLFGYVDFKPFKLVVEDSLVMRRKNTGEIADAVRRKTEELYGVPGVDAKGRPSIIYPVKPRRHGDMTPRELADLDQIYHCYFEPPPDRNDPDALIATLRDHVAKRHVVILKKNVALIRQLRNAIRDEKGKLTRSEQWGHWDAVMALVYMARVAPWLRNPGYEIPNAFDWSTQQVPSGVFSDKKQITSRSYMRNSFRRRFRHGR